MSDRAGIFQGVYTHSTRRSSTRPTIGLENNPLDTRTDHIQHIAAMSDASASRSPSSGPTIPKVLARNTACHQCR